MYIRKSNFDVYVVNINLYVIKFKKIRSFIFELSLKFELNVLFFNFNLLSFVLVCICLKI